MGGIDKEDIEKIYNYTIDDFAHWFESGYGAYYSEDDNFMAFEPLHGYVGLTGELTNELKEIYSYLNPSLKINFRGGLAKAFLGLEDIYVNIKIAKKMMFLSRAIYAREILEPIVQKIANGFFGDVDMSEEEKDNDLFEIALDVVKKLSDVTIGSYYIKRMIGSRYYSCMYSPKAFIALCHSDPSNYTKHLSLLRRCFYEINLDEEEKEYMYLTARRFLDNVDMQVFIEGFDELYLTGFPDESQVNDNWFIEAMFIGEFAPLDIKHIGYTYEITRKGSDLCYLIEITDDDEDYDMNEFMKNIVKKVYRKESTNDYELDLAMNELMI